jgi:multiple sugar transport system substrate-binding protein
MSKRMQAAVAALALALWTGGTVAQQIDVQYPAPGLFKEPIEKIVEDFQKAHPGIKVNLLGPQQDYEQIVQHNLRAAITNTLPDVAIHGMNRQRILVERGIAQPIDDFVRQDPGFAKLGITEKSRSVGLVGGKQYGIGLAMSTPVIYYNADLVKRAGGDPDKFPTTWDGIIDLAKRIEALDGGGKVRGMFLSWQITGNWMWQALVFSHGGTMLTADEKKVAFDGPAGQRAIGVLARLVNEANMPNSTFAAEAPNFIAGRLGMLSDSSAQISRFNREVGSAFPVKVAKFPISAADGRVPTGGAVILMLTKDPAKQKAAWEFMKFAAGPQGATTIVKSTGYVPATDLPAKDPTMLGDFYKSSPNHRVALELLPFVSAWYAFPGENGVKITDVIRDHLQTVVAKTAKPDDVLKRMAADTTALLPK